MFIWKKEFVQMLAEKAQLTGMIRVLEVENKRLEMHEDKLATQVVATRKEFEASCDRVLKLEALVLKQQDHIVSLQSARKAQLPDELSMDIFSEAPEDIQQTVDDIQKYGRDAVILREK